MKVAHRRSRARSVRANKRATYTWIRQFIPRARGRTIQITSSIQMLRIYGKPNRNGITFPLAPVDHQLPSASVLFEECDLSSVVCSDGITRGLVSMGGVEGVMVSGPFGGLGFCDPDSL
jgi:hypothetical protein